MDDRRWFVRVNIDAHGSCIDYLSGPFTKAGASSFAEGVVGLIPVVSRGAALVVATVIEAPADFAATAFRLATLRVVQEDQ